MKRDSRPARIITGAVLLVAILGVSGGQHAGAGSPEVEWTRVLHHAGYDVLTAVVPSGDGSVYLVGTTTLSPEAGSDAHGRNRFDVILVAKFSAAGDEIWRRYIRGKRGLWAGGADAAPDGSLWIAAAATNDRMEGPFSLRLYHVSGDGRVSVSRLPGRYLMPSGVAVAPDGGAYLLATGQFRRSDLALFRLDAGGALDWRRDVHGPGWNRGAGVEVARDGGVFVAAATELHIKNPPGFKFGGDLLFAHFDKAGELRWKTVIGEGGFSLAGGVAVHRRELYFAAQSYSDLSGAPNRGRIDAIVGALDIATGDVQWLRIYGGSRDDDARDLIVDAEGGPLVTGFTASDRFAGRPVAEPPSAYVLSLDSIGTPRERILVPASRRIESWSIARAGPAVFIAGMTWGRIGDSGPVEGENDIFVARVR